VDNILNHHLKVDASKVVAVDGDAIPTGEFIDVDGTPFDFRSEQAIGARWDDTIDLCGSGKSRPSAALQSTGSW
jgi:aldose 1-epimerase